MLIYNPPSGVHFEDILNISIHSLQSYQSLYYDKVGMADEDGDKQWFKQVGRKEECWLDPDRTSSSSFILNLWPWPLTGTQWILRAVLIQGTLSPPYWEPNGYYFQCISCLFIHQRMHDAFMYKHVIHWPFVFSPPNLRILTSHFLVIPPVSNDCIPFSSLKSWFLSWTEVNKQRFVHYILFL